MEKLSEPKKRAKELETIVRKTLSSKVWGIVSSINLPEVGALCDTYCCDFCSCYGTPCRDWGSDMCMVVFPERKLNDLVKKMDPKRFKTVKEALVKAGKKLERAKQ